MFMTNKMFVNVWFGKSMAINNVLIQTSSRAFAPKAPVKGGKAGGGPQAAASYVAPKRGKT